ncbi:MAG: metal-dependent transcriptional regulator [Candidatus Lokiarchaeota archaeon]|nr:metal-dependent transcriptional regulator [Candidatus Lokiarchaeota archaeon]
MIQIKETHEDYLKAIYTISKTHRGGWVSNSEISNFLKVKPSSVTNMLYKLKENYYIHWYPRKSVRLTAKGKEVALVTINKYNQLKHFFEDILGVENAFELDELCCKIEHIITSEISDALENFFLKEIQESI